MNPLPRVACLVATVALALIEPAIAESEGETLARGAGAGLIGQPAPRMVLSTVDGKTIDLGRLYGHQAVYLKFWATWCVPCREQMPHFERTYQQAGTDLAVIGINAGFNDTPADVRAYRREHHISMPLVVDDGQVAAAFHLRVTPQHIVIGRDGRILHVGHLADAKLDAALVAARNAPPDRGPQDARHGRQPSSAPHYSIGDPLPSIALYSIDGTRVLLRDRDDARPTVLVFLSPWCESYLATTRPALSANCRRAREWAANVAPTSDARWIGIASGLWATQEDLRAYQRQYPLAMPLTLDDSGDVFHAFQVQQVPTIWIASAAGRLVRKVTSAELPDEQALRDAVRVP